MIVDVLAERKQEPFAMHLSLLQCSFGVKLIGTDSCGEKWEIAVLNEKGIELMPAISARTGWPLEKGNRLKVVK